MFLGLTQDYAVDTATPLAQFNYQKLLINQGGQFSLTTNICPHQGSRITGKVTRTLRCAYHGWQFGLDGHGIGHDLSLASQPVWINGNMIFDRHVDVDLGVDLRYMTLYTQRTEIVDAAVPVIMDVFLDREHIPVVHAGVYEAVGISDVTSITTRTFDNGSLQTVAPSGSGLAIDDDSQLGIAAQWLAVYPGTMIEWQPGALFVTVANAIDLNRSSVQVYKYHDDRYDRHAWQLNQTVWEQAWAQDREISSGIISLATDPDDELKQHHRAWMRNAV